METIRFDPQTGQPVLQQPVAQGAPQPIYAVARKTFTVSPAEKLLAVLSYPAAFLYICACVEGRSITPILFTAFTLVYCLGVEFMYRRTSCSRERWFWLAAMVLCTVPPFWGGGRVWGDNIWLILHGFAVYYTLCRSDRLMEGRTSHLLPLDAVYGAVIFPFYYFFLRIRVLYTSLKDRRTVSGTTMLWSFMAISSSVIVFILSVTLLQQADSGFARLVMSIFSFGDFDLNPFLIRLVISLPAGAWIYGLVAGAGRESVPNVRARGERICKALAQLRGVPGKLWISLLAVFALLYGVFFFVQGRYLFGAFTRTLPGDFTVAEYARQGFFELCKVMVLNFALLWLALRSSLKSARAHYGLRAAATVILAESLLLAVTAASKLWLYIDCFGFTPLRLQSAWLIVSLSFGVICAAWSLWTNRRSMRAWAVFSGLSLALLNLY